MDITITKTCYEDISVNKLHPEIEKQRRDLISVAVILHHDNASAHTSFLVSSTIHKLLRHLVYSLFVFCFKRLSEKKTRQ